MGEALAMRHGSARSKGQTVKECGVEELRRRYAEVKRYSDLEKTARNYKAQTAVGCDGFHPKVPWI